MTRVSKRKVDGGEREDRERRNYPTPPRRRINGAIQTPAERNLLVAASAIHRFSCASRYRDGNAMVN
jgi:hypothetical protein